MVVNYDTIIQYHIPYRVGMIIQTLLPGTKIPVTMLMYKSSGINSGKVKDRWYPYLGTWYENGLFKKGVYNDRVLSEVKRTNNNVSL